MAGIPSPLGIGTIALSTGETIKGFLCETAGLEGAEEITAFGGWRSYLGAQQR
jgi:allophanate hydrolase